MSDAADVPPRGAGADRDVGGTRPGAAPYERLAELAEAELAACEAGRPEVATDLYAEAAAIVAGLPSRPPAAAEPALRRAALAQQRTAELLAARLAERGADLERLRRGREAARSYAAGAAART